MQDLCRSLFSPEGYQQYRLLQRHLPRFVIPGVSCESNKVEKICEKIGRDLSVFEAPHSLKLSNRLEANYHLSNKKALFYNITRYFRSIGDNPFDHVPTTFHIKDGVRDPQYKAFLAYYQRKKERMRSSKGDATKGKKGSTTEPKEEKGDDKGPGEFGRYASVFAKNIWIVKPGECSNRGHGISVCNDLSQINSVINSAKMQKNGRPHTYIVQEYIDKPLLFKQRKFDFRCFMLITSVNGFMKGYWY